MRPLPALALLLLGCPDPPPLGETDSDTDQVSPDDTDPPPASLRRTVVVTLDGTPTEGVVVVQGGVNRLHRTDAAGEVVMDIDLAAPGEAVVVASHPAARQAFVEVRPGAPEPLAIALETFSPTDNPDYVFQDPGTPDRRDTTLQCSHCHTSIGEDWFGSVHRSAASNDRVHDLYAGTVAALADAGSCEAAGGTWATGLGPGTGAPAERCYLGPGVLPELDPDCAPNCDGATAVTAGCADCHAPGIDGALGGRGLLEATGRSHDYGVHCDVCHKVAAVDPTDPTPGVGGRLRIHRPSEPAANPIAGPWEPIQFGPHHDSPNPRMGSVQRDHYESGLLCSGCHEYTQEALLPGATLDPARWPEGRLPVQSTFSEWQDPPFDGRIPCNACHMPPAPDRLNGADLQDLLGIVEPGVAAGWARPPGAVRQHTWLGPRTPGAEMLRVAASLDVEVLDDDRVLEVRVTTTNVGAGHRLPTGEPSRQVILHVAATCDGLPQPAVGGAAIPPWVGALDAQDADGDWLRWPEARVGETVRVLRRDGFRDEPRWGPFGDGTFTGEAAGLDRWEVVAVRTITAVDGDVVSLDGPLPSGERALRGPPLDPPVDGERARADAGAPGHAFARVLADPEGRTTVPHHRAVDVVSDNRLAPHAPVTTRHRFAPTCARPEVTATLTWRAHPWWLARAKRWENPARVMVEVRR